MPLSNDVIIKLNEITTVIHDRNNLREEDVVEIKKMFFDILQKGNRYDVEEIESWLENEGSWTSKNSRTRIVNLSHYVQSKFDQTTTFKTISNHDSESCGESCSCGN